MGVCLAQGLSYEVAALVVVFIKKGAPVEVGVWRQSMRDVVTIFCPGQKITNDILSSTKCCYDQPLNHLKRGKILGAYLNSLLLPLGQNIVIVPDKMVPDKMMLQYFVRGKKSLRHFVRDKNSLRYFVRDKKSQRHF